MSFAGCAAHTTTPPVEQVGALSSGSSVYTAPLAHDAPPELGLVVSSDDNSVTSTVTTTTRAEPDAGTDDAEAPEVVDKGTGVQLGAVR